MRSRWVRTEIALARQKEEREHRHVLFPVALVPYNSILPWRVFDGDLGDDSAREIRRCFIPDFTQWHDPEVYRSTFNNLLRDLLAD